MGHRADSSSISTSSWILSRMRPLDAGQMPEAGQLPEAEEPPACQLGLHEQQQEEAE